MSTAPNLLHDEETRRYGDSAYRGKARRERLKTIAPNETNRRKSSVRSKVEHPFLVIKRLWGFAQFRYRGLRKNATRAFAILALANLVKWGRPLTEEVWPV